MAALTASIMPATQREFLQKKIRGAMIGLIVGDALGSQIRFENKIAEGDISFFSDIKKIKNTAGRFSGAAAMSVCLAESLLINRGFNLVDQIDRYAEWYQENEKDVKRGALSLGHTTAAGIEKYLDLGIISAQNDKWSCGSSALVRAVSIPLFFRKDVASVLRFAGLSAQSTHGHELCSESCQYLAGIVLSCLYSDSSKPPESILSKDFDLLQKPWNQILKNRELLSVVEGDYKSMTSEQLNSSGMVLDTLRIALWCFYTTNSFSAALLKATSFGGGAAHSIGAVCGQLAGAYYGVDEVPFAWSKKVDQADYILDLADDLIMVGEVLYRPTIN